MAKNVTTIGDLKQYNYIVVGAGLFGLTVAERLAKHSAKSVLVIEKRQHIGGNAYSEFDDETGIEVHKYGSHIFHTSNREVWEYINTFTSFTPYIHHVRTKHQGQVYQMPINLHTINQFLKTDFSPTQAQEWVMQCSQEISKIPANLEEKAISLIGRPLYEAFIKGYTEKQWQNSPRELPPEIISRLPVRFNYNGRYFNDTYQGLPTDGYAKLVENMTQNRKIKIALGTDYFELRDQIQPNQTLIFTGPIDQYFNYSQGRLNWRTLDFEYEKLEVADYQGTSVMNYADLDTPFVRVHEFKHLHPERMSHSSAKTIIAREFSRSSGLNDEPFYPINLGSDRQKLKEYRKMAEQLSNVYFGGRLGRYQYLDMHMAISSALLMTKEILNSNA